MCSVFPAMCAKNVIDAINTMIEEQKIKNPNDIYLFLDEMDITYKDSRYEPMCNQHRYDEAFDLPNLLTKDAKELLMFCSRLGVNVILYTTRVDTKRVDVTVRTFSHVLDVGFPVVKKVVCLRTEQNELLPISRVMDECDIPPNDVTFGVLACSFQLRINDFLNNAKYFTIKKAVCF